MKLVTIPEAVDALKDCGVKRGVLERMIAKGELQVLNVGVRRMVDLERLMPLFEGARAGVSAAEIARRTGLNTKAVRRGAKEGWIPHWMFLGRLLFDPEDVERAIRARMAGEGEAE